MTDEQTVSRLRRDAHALRQWARDHAVQGCGEDPDALCQEADQVDDAATRIELWSIFDRPPPQ